MKERNKKILLNEERKKERKERKKERKKEYEEYGL